MSLSIKNDSNSSLFKTPSYSNPTISPSMPNLPDETPPQTSQSKQTMWDNICFKTSKITTKIDPRIQYYMFQDSVGLGTQSIYSADKGYVPVIAKITSLEPWKQLTEVQCGAEIRDNNGWLVTGRIPISQIKSVRS